MRDIPEDRLRSALASLHPSARYVRVERIDLEAFMAQFDACNEAYTNNSEERDLYEIAYRDMRKVVGDVLGMRGLLHNARDQLEAVFTNGEVR